LVPLGSNRRVNARAAAAIAVCPIGAIGGGQLELFRAVCRRRLFSRGHRTFGAGSAGFVSWCCRRCFYAGDLEYLGYQVRLLGARRGRGAQGQGDSEELVPLLCFEH
jgi:hypothetical protein